MKLWVDSEAVGSAGRVVRIKVSEMTADINRKVISRASRSVQAMRNAELRVLKGQRSGRKYRKPFTKHASYHASAPGEPPARRTGNLRLHWNGQVKTGGMARGGITVIAELESQEPYASHLENGTSKMAARPFAERIKEEAAPEIRKIYEEHYT